MTNELFNIFSAVGIFLTFFASMVAAIISFKSMKDSKLAAKQSALNSTVTAGRDKWSYALRENASLYFTQIARLCNGQETDVQAIYNELTRYHFSIVFLLSSQHDYDVRIHDCMSAIRSKALEIVEISKNKSLSPEVAQKDIENLRLSIWKEYGDEVFNGITFLIRRGRAFRAVCADSSAGRRPPPVPLSVRPCAPPPRPRSDAPFRGFSGVRATKAQSAPNG